MAAGRLDRRVLFETLTTERDAFGSVAETSWAEICTVWAERVDASDTERFGSGAEKGSAVSVRWRIRSSEETRGITAKDRLTCDSVVHEIMGIKEMAKPGRQRYLEVTTAFRDDA